MAVSRRNPRGILRPRNGYRRRPLRRGMGVNRGGCRFGGPGGGLGNARGAGRGRKG